ncbi:MAG: 50S ribosomal protein L25 [Ignavibacteriaceae bacterium]|nr:50S ribosomal protein L25 [Ignavibacteriaceae bacterium]
MEKKVLDAKIRTITTKKSRNDLRRNARIPGVYYSKKDQPLAIDVAENSLKPLVFTSETHLISLQISGQEERECIIKDVQFDPVTDEIIHFDLLGLIKGEKINIEVPVQLTGSAIGVKEGGVLQHQMHKIEISCLPKDIPEHITVDVTALRIGDAIHIKDLNFENITFVDSPDSIIVSVTHAKVEKEPVTTEAAEQEPIEPEVIAKGKAEKEEE